MKESNDDKIQRILENGMSGFRENNAPDDQEDLKLYSRLFDELNKEPEVKLSYSFSSNVIRKIKYQKQRRADVKLALLVGSLVIAGLLVFVNSPYFKEALPAMSGSKWIIFAGLLFLAIIQFMDQKLVIERRLPK